MYTPPPNRVLNRHRRGRPKFPLGRKVMSRLKKLIPPALVISLILGLLYALDKFGVL